MATCRLDCKPRKGAETKMGNYLSSYSSPFGHIPTHIYAKHTWRGLASKFSHTHSLIKHARYMYWTCYGNATQLSPVLHLPCIEHTRLYDFRGPRVALNSPRPECANDPYSQSIQALITRTKIKQTCHGPMQLEAAAGLQCHAHFT